MKLMVILVAVGAALYWMFAPAKPMFDDSTIASIQRDIRDEYQKRDGFRVLEVSMMRESERKLVGFARLQIEGLKKEVSKDCTATMSDTGGKTMWSCK